MKYPKSYRKNLDLGKIRTCFIRVNPSAKAVINAGVPWATKNNKGRNG